MWEVGEVRRSLEGVRVFVSKSYSYGHQSGYNIVLGWTTSGDRLMVGVGDGQKAMQVQRRCTASACL